MSIPAWGRRVAALILLTLFPSTCLAASITVTRIDGGTELARYKLADGEGWCIVWNHSVQLFEVTDCYEIRDGRMTLVKSHQPDFAAGLGEIPGRGKQVSDGRGGYWILDINEPVPANAYVLRPGRQETVNHRIVIAGRTHSLSELAEHERIRLAIELEQSHE